MFSREGEFSVGAGAVLLFGILGVFFEFYGGVGGSRGREVLLGVSIRIYVREVNIGNYWNV